MSDRTTWAEVFEESSPIGWKFSVKEPGDYAVVAHEHGFSVVKMIAGQMFGVPESRMSVDFDDEENNGPEGENWEAEHQAAIDALGSKEELQAIRDSKTRKLTFLEHCKLEGILGQ